MEVVFTFLLSDNIKHCMYNFKYFLVYFSYGGMYGRSKNLEEMQQLNVNGRFYTVKGFVPFMKQ